MNIALLMLCAVASGFAVYAYETSQPVPTAQIIEVPQFVEVEKVVEVEKIVEVIKTVEVVQLAVQNTNVPHTTPQPTEELVQVTILTEEPCTNVAWVVSQPFDDAQGSAMEYGRISRLNFRLRNDGTCIWSGYVLTSGGVLPDIPIPFTMPGEIATFHYDFYAYNSLVARFVLQPPDGGLFMTLNSAGPQPGEEEIFYRLEVYKKPPILVLPPGWPGGG
jgi:hypothetical protein